MPRFEGLEDRIVLSTITWDSADYPTGGSWDVGQHWMGGVVPTSTDDAVIDLTSAGSVFLNSNHADSVNSVTTNSYTTLAVSNGSLSVGGGTSSFGGPASVAQGAALSFGAGAKLTIAATQTVSDAGTLTFSSGDTVTFTTTQYDITQIAVNTGGVLKDTSTDFATPSNPYESASQINVNSGGELVASGDTFGLTDITLAVGSVLNAGDFSNNIFNTTLSLPAQDVALLGTNQSFDAVDILAGSLNSGQSLDLNLMGTVSTLNLVYVFAGTFTVESGASVTAVGDVQIYIGANVTVTDSGTITLGSGDNVTLDTSQYDTTQLAVNSGGVLNATSTDFLTPANLPYEATTPINVNSGGELVASGSTFDVTSLTLANGSVLKQGDLSNDLFSTTFYLPAQDIALLGANQSFDAVEILAGSLNSGQTLALNLMGTVSTFNRRPS
jgi:hypothetical protein